MKKCLFILTVCLMVTGAYATNSWVGPTGSWSNGALWGSGHVPNDGSDGETKILKTGVVSCTIDSALNTLNTSKITVNGASKGACTLYIVEGGSLAFGGEMIAGSGNGGGQGPIGTIVQTGGTLTTNGTSTSGRLEVGYKSASSGIGQGYYTISGGTITGTGSLYVGAVSGTGTGGANGGVGTFTVQGNGGSISVANLNVGAGDATGVWTGTGTLEYQIVGGAVSAITAGNVFIDPATQASAVANLLVTVTSGVPAAVILLVDNTGANAVDGAFDNVTLGAELWNYTLDYEYDSATGNLTGGNDIALIPEPVTIALLGLGFLAIRRKK